jgi:hypothetical protein
MNPPTRLLLLKTPRGIDDSPARCCSLRRPCTASTWLRGPANSAPGPAAPLRPSDHPATPAPEQPLKLNGSARRCRQVELQLIWCRPVLGALSLPMVRPAQLPPSPPIRAHARPLLSLVSCLLSGAVAVNGLTFAAAELPSSRRRAAELPSSHRRAAAGACRGRGGAGRGGAGHGPAESIASADCPRERGRRVVAAARAWRRPWRGGDA